MLKAGRNAAYAGRHGAGMAGNQTRCRQACIRQTDRHVEDRQARCRVEGANAGAIRTLKILVG